MDIAHARTETLLAFLFGYEIVVPANDIADSPGFQTILSEIAETAKSTIQEHKKRHGVAPSLFTVGLEPQYRARNNLTGYNAFASAYGEEILEESRLGTSTRELTAITEQEDDKWQTPRLLRALAAIYFDEEPHLVKELERAKPEIALYARLVRKTFHPAENYGVKFVYSPKNDLSSGLKANFATFARSSLKRARRRGADDKIILGISKPLEKLLHSDLPLDRRMRWRVHQDEFGEQWEVVRDWLDLTVYGKLFAAFGVNVGSYFTQECTDNIRRNDVRMGALTDRAFSIYREATDGDSLLPQLDRVEWGEILAFIQSQPVQEAIVRFHQAIADALASSGAEREALLSDARKRHIDFLAAQDNKLSIERYIDGGGKVRREAGIYQANAWAEKTADGTRFAAKVGSVAVKPSAGLLANWTNLIGEAAGRYVAKPVGSVVERLVRPSQKTAVAEGHILLDKESNRLNFWIR